MILIKQTSSENKCNKEMNIGDDEAGRCVNSETGVFIWWQVNDKVGWYANVRQVCSFDDR